jgi:hypothetical protein
LDALRAAGVVGLWDNDEKLSRDYMDCNRFSAGHLLGERCTRAAFGAAEQSKRECLWTRACMLSPEANVIDACSLGKYGEG